MSTLYDLDSVKARVTGDIEAARLLYAEEIFSWTDAYSETHGPGEEAGAEQLLHRQAIGRLWMRFAAMEQQLKQWKKTVQVFEDALLDEVASHCLELYLAYVGFCRARGKISSAQKVLVRALTATGPLHAPPMTPVRVHMPPSSTLSDGGMRELLAADLLWAQFLLMMRSSSSGGGDSPDLKLEQLHTMLSSQVGAGSPLAPPSSFELVEEISARLAECGESGPGGNNFDRLVEALVLGKNEAEREQEQMQEAYDLPKDESPHKRPRLDTPAGSSTSSAAVQDGVGHSDKPGLKSGGPLSRGQGLEQQHEQPPPSNAARGMKLPSLVDFDDMSGLGSSGGLESMLTSLLTSFRDRPTLLFSATHKEPLSSGFRGLDAALIGDIERMFASCGVKAGHASAESLEMELLAASKTQHGTVAHTLDVLEGLWTCQGLKEGHFDLWFSSLLGSHRQEEEVLRRENYEEEARMRATKPSATSMAILRSKHENALRSRRIYASLQTDLLNANVNRILCVLRKEQGDVLRLINFPYSHEFDSDALYSFHNLKKGKLEKDEKTVPDSNAKFEHMEVCFQKQRAIIGALLSLSPAHSPTRAPLVPPVAVPAAVPVPLLERGASSFSISSTGSHTSPRSPDGSSVVVAERSSSTKKKRRRKLVDSQEQHESLRRRSGSGSGYSTGAGGLDFYDPHGTSSAGVGTVEGETGRGRLLGHNSGANPATHPSNQAVPQQASSPPAFTTRPLIPLTALARPSSTSAHSSAAGVTPPFSAPAAGSAKATNLAKIAALLASKKAGKK